MHCKLSYSRTKHKAIVVKLQNKSLRILYPMYLSLILGFIQVLIGEDKTQFKPMCFSDLKAVVHVFARSLLHGFNFRLVKSSLNDIILLKSL